MFGAVSNDKHRLVLMFAYGCGLRLSEIQELRPSDIIGTGMLFESKGKDRKTDRLCSILGWLGAQNYLLK